jgi:hypothetical protein
MKKAHALCTRALGVKDAVAVDQRFAMYIVISKPKRRSVKAGVVHCMVKSPVGVGTKHVCELGDA